MHHSLPIQVMTAGPLPAPSKCKLGLPRITGTFSGWWKQSFWLRLWSLVWFQVSATSCHLRSSKSAWKSTPKGTWMYWRVWWSLGAIRWRLADPGCGSRTRRHPQVQRNPGLTSEGVIRLCTLLSLAPSSPDLNPVDNFVWSYVENTTSMTTTPKPAWLPPSAEYSPSSSSLWKRYVPSSASRWCLRLKAATLNRCQLYYIIKLPELIFSTKVLK